MKIHEYQAKEILAQYGLPIPPGHVATTPEEAREAAAQLGGMVVIKAQVLVGGRGKAGGVKLASNPDEAAEKAAAILGMDIKGITVQRVLVAQAVDIAAEIYLGVILDRTSKAITIMASAEGGVEIEEVARETPEKIHRIHVHPLAGFADYQGRQLAFDIGIPKDLSRGFAGIVRTLVQALIENDAELVEINPLVITEDGELQCIDAKINLDDNALYRHKELAALRDHDEEEPAEQAAREAGLSFVKLDGTIGCVVNGAGLAMATMDTIKLSGGSPANFLDIGGGARAESVANALSIILDDENVNAILFNIFGGITRCDEVARGIVSAVPTLSRQVPMVVRLVGTNQEEGRAILQEAGLVAADTMQEASQEVVRVASAPEGAGA
jgi:succinyl-CoA synthetase beta subunit